jgi:hypothetical protein
MNHRKKNEEDHQPTDKSYRLCKFIVNKDEIPLIILHIQ